MKKGFYYLFIIILTNAFSFSSNEKELTAEEILAKSSEAILKSKIYSYDFSSQMKYFDDKDTSLITGNLVMERMPADSALGCNIKIRSKRIYDSVSVDMEHFYNGKKTYYINHSEKSALIDDSETNGAGVTDGGFISGNTISRVIFKPLKNKIPFQIVFDDSTKIILHEDTKVDRFDCYKIEVKKPDDNMFKDIYTIFFIDKKTFLPRRRIFHGEFQQTHQYEDLVISKLETMEAKNKQLLTEPVIPENYETEYYIPSSYKIEALLENGTIAPDFELPGLTEKIKLKLQDLRGQTVLLDFWYVSCYPCKKIMPYLEALHNKYKKKGLVVLGINPIDVKRTSKELKEFLIKQNVTYTTLGDFDKKTTNQYKVQIYPSMYLIDKKGKIVFSHMGFSEESAEKIEAAVEEAMR